MMEESVSEWGQVIALKAIAQLPLRQPLLKVFATAQSSHLSRQLAASSVSGDFNYQSQRLALVPFTKRQIGSIAASALHRESSLAAKYSRPRFINHPVAQGLEHKVQKPFVSVLLLTAASTFTAWYVYRITNQKLALQAQVREYADQLQSEQHAKAAIVSSQVKIFTLAGATEQDISAKVFWDTENQSCLIYLKHLPATRIEQYFQLWFYTKDCRFIKSKSFHSGEDAVEVHVQIPKQQMNELERVLVSVESTIEVTGPRQFPAGQIIIKGMLR